MCRPYSTASVGGIAPGRDEERNVVLPVGLGDGEADRDEIEEWRVGRIRSDGPEIGPHIENELISARAEGLSAQERRIRPPIGVRGRDGNEVAAVFIDEEELDRDSLRGAAMRCIKNVGRQAPHGTSSKRSATVSMTRRDVKPFHRGRAVPGAPTLCGARWPIWANAVEKAGSRPFRN